MSSFLNIRRSRPEECCKKCVLKINILQNSLKNIHDAVFKLIKFQAKGLQLYWKESPAYLLSYEFRRRFKGVRDPPPPPVKRPARGFTGWVRVRLGIGLSLESRGLFPGGFFPRTVLTTPILYNSDRLLLPKYLPDLLKIKIVATDKFSEAAIYRYLSK